MSISERKNDHIKICLEEDVDGSIKSPWEEITLPHCANPNIDFAEINIENTLFDRKFSSPFCISSMTGGTPHAEQINKSLATLAKEENIPLALGSQRILLEENKTTGVSELRKQNSEIFLMLNLGLVQLNYGVAIEDCFKLVEHHQAQAFVFHLNPLQEVIQKEGDTNFKELFKKFEAVAKKLKDQKIWIVVKETGCGLDTQSARCFVDLGADVIENSGWGGSHWGYIEGLRSKNKSDQDLGKLFRNWGIPSPQNLIDLKKKIGDQAQIIASGGIKNGLDAARSIYLGASAVGLAKPFLVAAQKDLNQLRSFYQSLCQQLKLSIFCTGAKDIRSLAKLSKHGE